MRNLSIPLPPLVRILPLALALSLAGQAAAAAPPAAKKPAAQKPAAQKPAAAPKTPSAETPAGSAPGTAAKPAGKSIQEMAASRPAQVPLTPQPPDGKWLVDEQGRKYFITQARRIEGSYMWLNEEHTQVRLPYGLAFDVASYDDQYFNVKIYQVADEVASPVPSKKSPEEIEKVAATYRTDVKSAHRLDFQPFDKGLPTRGQWRHGLALADMNGDGHLDIVHGPPRKGGGQPVIFLGDGKGNWKQWTAVSFPPVPFDYGAAAVADLNGDGRQDLVIASHLKGVTAMLGDGKGHFTLWSKGIEFATEGATSPAFSSRAVQIADWNGDGRPDILVAGEGPRLAVGRSEGLGSEFNRGSRGLRVYVNNGDGSWGKIDEEGNSSFGDSLALGDFNGDHHLDFAMGISILGYRGLIGESRPDGTWQRSNVAELRPSAIIQAVAAADLNGDRRDDLAVSYASNELGTWRSGIDILYARTDGTWERRALANQESPEGLFALAFGDLDGDGARDLVGLTAKGEAWVFLGDGKGWFTREDGAPKGDLGCRGYSARLVDLDGDGKDELVAGFAGEGTTGGIMAEVLSTGEKPAAECATGGSLRVWKAVKAKGAAR
jgi:hypothetical protein